MTSVETLAAWPPGMNAGRAPGLTDTYHAYLRTLDGVCALCVPKPEHLICESGSMRVIINAFPYQVWDGLHVEDHLMVVPVRHTLALEEFTDIEAGDFFTLMRRYEADGYSVYMRSASNGSRSVGHAHLHLIKTQPRG